MQMAQVLQENPWLATALIALVAAIGATMVHRYGRALVLRATRGSTMLQAVFTETESAAGAVLPLAALQVVWTAAPDDLRFIQNIQHVNGLLLIAALTWLAMRVITGIGNGVIARHPVTMEDNLQARRIQTQANVLARSASVVILLAGTAMGLMTFPGARQVGASLLASAGVIGLVAGIAARPVFSNLISGLQIALAQPIRMDDVLIVKGEWGRVEEITGTYVVLKIWDERRLSSRCSGSLKIRSRTGRAAARSYCKVSICSSISRHHSTRYGPRCGAWRRQRPNGTAGCACCM